MWIFLVIILATGVLNMSIRFSLFEKNGNSLIAIIASILALSFTYTFAIRINIQDITSFMNDYSTLVNVCIIVMLEAIVLLLLVTRLLTAHVNNSTVTWSKIIALSPSISGLIGLFISLVYVLNCISGWQLGLLAFISLAAVLVALILFQLFLRTIASWQLRFDLILLLSFVQIIIAMFLPLLINGGNISISDNHNLGRDFYFSILAFLSVGGVSYLIRKFIYRYFGAIKK